MDVSQQQESTKQADIRSPAPQKHSDLDDDVVTMLELVTAAHTLDNSVMNAKELLTLMDICTCAAAEKHTRMQCVTVRMGDVVFEYFPRCGDLLELTARPIYTAGRTSLEVALLVVAEVVVSGKIRRTVVCEASFTYVTTRGPNGEKRLCPPLAIQPKTGGEQYEWDRKIALHRKSLLQMERMNDEVHNSNTTDGRADAGFSLEMTEVVLPAHQNHMGHTFGGVVMAWMAKAALAAAMRASKRSGTSLLIRSIVRVEFQCGSDVSDHLILRPRITAVFDKGRSAEVEVRVVKRSLATGEETRMNVGYFFISGSAIGTGTDVPFDGLSSPTDAASPDRIREEAEWRRRLLLARRHLLSGLGSPVEWHSSLSEEAPLLTVASVLRLVHHNDRSVDWLDLSSELKKALSSPLSNTSAVEWTRGESWGRNDTFVLRVKGVLPGARMLADVLDTLRSHRPEWDNFCGGVDILESPEASNSPTSLDWDVVRHLAITPKVAVDARKLALGTASGHVPLVVPLCLLRTWQVDTTKNTAILASQSVWHKNVDRVSAQVRPSGWFLRNNDPSDGVKLTYIAEHDLVHLRQVCLGMSDEDIVKMLAHAALGWLERLGGLLDL